MTLLREIVTGINHFDEEFVNSVFDKGECTDQDFDSFADFNYADEKFLTSVIDTGVKLLTSVLDTFTLKVLSISNFLNKSSRYKHQTRQESKDERWKMVSRLPYPFSLSTCRADPYHYHHLQSRSSHRQLLISLYWVLPASIYPPRIRLNTDFSAISSLLEAHSSALPSALYWARSAALLSYYICWTGDAVSKWETPWLLFLYCR